MKRYLILPTNKIAMFIFNLLPFVDYFLKERPKDCVVFFPSLEWMAFLGREKRIANEQLYQMCLRALRENNVPYSHSRILSLIYHVIYRLFPGWISKKGDFRNDREFYSSRKRLFGIMPQYPAETRTSASDLEAFNRDKPFFRFTRQEIEHGNRVLLSQEIDTSKEIVTFHARDDAYYQHTAEAYRFRNSRFADAAKALRYLESRDIYVFRMGARQESVEKRFFSERIVDYSSQFRSDFMDVFLVGRSKFLIGNTSGLWGLPYLFANIPILGLNFIPVHYVPLTGKDIYVPKKLWLRKEKRFMRLREILGIDFVTQYNSSYYAKNDIEVIDNDEHEILEVVQEMNERIDGKVEYDDGDEELQERVRSIFGESLSGHKPPSRIGREFIRRNRYLLE